MGIRNFESDEPILIDGMQYADFKAMFDVSIYDVEIKDFVWEFFVANL